MLTDHFSIKEMSCKCCGACFMDYEFMEFLEDIRVKYGKPMIITSAYRCQSHNNKVSGTGTNGPHTTGKAVDIAVRGEEAYNLLKIIMEDGRAQGIGVSQKGNSRFIHIDTLEGSTRPWVWSY